jgi:hypothetical protein
MRNRFLKSDYTHLEHSSGSLAVIFHLILTSLRDLSTLGLQVEFIRALAVKNRENVRKRLQCNLVDNTTATEDHLQFVCVQIVPVDRRRGFELIDPTHCCT